MQTDYPPQTRVTVILGGQEFHARVQSQVTVDGQRGYAVLPDGHSELQEVPENCVFPCEEVQTKD